MRMSSKFSKIAVSVICACTSSFGIISAMTLNADYKRSEAIRTIEKTALQIIINDQNNIYGEDYEFYIIRANINNIVFEDCMGLNFGNSDDFINWMEAGGKDDFIGLDHYELFYESPGDGFAFDFYFDKQGSECKMVFPWYITEINLTTSTSIWPDSALMAYPGSGYMSDWPFLEDSLAKITYSIEGYSYGKDDTEVFRTPVKSDPIKVYPFVYKIISTANGSGTVNITESPLGLESNEYYKSQKITLTATPTGSATFDHWEANGVALEGKGATFDTYATADTTYTAVFTSSGMSATDFANEFNTNIGAQCYDAGGVKTGFLDAWKLEATNWETVTDKDTLTNATYSDADPIGSCVEKYDMAFIKNYATYKDSGMTDFMGRFTDAQKTALANSRPYSILNGDSNDQSSILVIIIVISSLLLLSTGATLVLIKKRKHQ